MTQYGFYFELFALHRLQNLRTRLQGLPRPGARHLVPPHLRLRGWRLGEDPRGGVEQDGFQLPSGRLLQPLRQPRLRGKLPHGRHAERRRDGPCERRPGSVHRLRHLPEVMPLRRAAHRCGAVGLPQVRRLPGPRAQRRAAHVRRLLPRCALWSSAPPTSCARSTAISARCRPCPKPTTGPNLVIGSCQAIDSDTYNLDEGYLANPLGVE